MLLHLEGFILAWEGMQMVKMADGFKEFLLIDQI